MINDFKEAISSELERIGFMPADITSQPRSSALKDEYIAFVSLKQAKCPRRGYDFNTGAKRHLHEYTFECRLLGRQGDCSDRDTLTEMAETARFALMLWNFDVTVIHDMKIDPVLSRAECVLRVTVSTIYTD